VSTSNPAIQVRIGPRVSAAHLAVIATVFLVGLLTGVLVAGGRLQPATTRVSPVHQTVPVSGPQDHIADMIGLRSRLHGHRFPIPAGH
jgi:hypothetical protein